MSQEGKVLIGIGIVTVIIIIIAAFSFGGKGTLDQSSTKPADPSILTRKDSNKLQSKNNKVTVVEFGDFQCPACGAAHPIVAQILEDYKDDVTFVFRNYPLAVHKNAKLAAYAAEAAGTQGKFFPMFDKLYENQKEWGESNNPVEHFVTYAKELKLDADKLKKEIEDKTYEKKVMQDVTDGNTLGVSATPTFYIDGEEVVGGIPYSEFKQKIDAAISKK